VNYLQNIALFIALIVLLSSGITGQESSHVVGRGETIYSISRTYRISPEELMRVNGISDPSKLQAGRRLVIPSSAFNDIPVPSVRTVEYTVARGDTLYSIARTNGISLETLFEINSFTSNHVIKVGEKIKIPAREIAAASGANTTITWPVNPREITYMTGQLGVIVQGITFEPVRSLTQGKVISAGPWRKFGQVVIIETMGGYHYMYGGCESLSVKVGDNISPGTELGKLGINSTSEKPQLFFMVFRSNVPIDPAKAPRAGSNT
jgi:LysM repeat protein